MIEPSYLQDKGNRREVCMHSQRKRYGKTMGAIHTLYTLGSICTYIHRLHMLGRRDHSHTTLQCLNAITIQSKQSLEHVIVPQFIFSTIKIPFPFKVRPFSFVLCASWPEHMTASVNGRSCSVILESGIQPLNHQNALSQWVGIHSKVMQRSRGRDGSGGVVFKSHHL